MVPKKNLNGWKLLRTMPINDPFGGLSMKEMYRMLFPTFPNPIFYPSKHTKMSYAAQNRAAKKRRKSKK